MAKKSFRDLQICRNISKCGKEQNLKMKSWLLPLIGEPDTNIGKSRRTHTRGNSYQIILFEQNFHFCTPASIIVSQILQPCPSLQSRFKWWRAARMGWINNVTNCMGEILWKSIICQHFLWLGLHMQWNYTVVLHL